MTIFLAVIDKTAKIIKILNIHLFVVVKIVIAFKIYLTPASQKNGLLINH